MITKPVLKKLAENRLTDAKVLLNNRRYFAAIYLAGYSLELVLKYRICMLLKFNNGFPEDKLEFNSYYLSTTKGLLQNTVRELKDIRHHNLSKLLRYSGEQVNIESKFTSDLIIVKDWTPEMRYSINTIRKQKAVNFLKSAKVIVDEL